MTSMFVDLIVISYYCSNMFDKICHFCLSSLRGPFRAVAGLGCGRMCHHSSCPIDPTTHRRRLQLNRRPKPRYSVEGLFTLQSEAIGVLSGYGSPVPALPRHRWSCPLRTDRARTGRYRDILEQHLENHCREFCGRREQRGNVFP